MSTSPSPPSLHWGVVGGGMLGLTLAHRLVQAGQRVTVFEAADDIGGLAGAWQLGGVTWDKHYHVTLLSDEHLRGLLAELDLDDQMQWVETRTGFFTDGCLHSMSNTLEFLRFPPLRLFDKLRLGLTIFAASRIKNWRPLEQTLVGDWLRRWSGERTFRKIWEPLLLAKLGQSYRRTSAAFIWATIARMYAARRTGLKKEMFGYAPGGYARVLERFAERLRAAGVDLRTSTRVSRIAADKDGDGGITVETASGEEHFDRVVVTCPSPLLTKMCPELGDDERRRHDQIEYLGIICASVLLDRPLADFYVTNITDGGMPFTAVIEMTSLVDRAQTGGQCLVYLPRYVNADDEAWGWTDQQIQDRFIAALEHMYPTLTADNVKAFRVSRASHVMALPTLDYSQRLPPLATAIPGVFAVNSAHIVKGTLNVNEVVKLADETFANLLQPSIHDAPPADRGEPALANLSSSVDRSDQDFHDAAAGELVARSR